MAGSLRPFGNYLLDRRIARGGMSDVYLARLRGLGGFEKRLVVKQVRPDLAREPRFVTMFVQEAQTLVAMSHPHLAPVYELGVVDGIYFLSMEYVDGVSLAKMLQQGALGPALVAQVGAEVADALHYAHSRFGLVHRDVTPRNIMIDTTGHSRLIDFGIAAPVSDASETAIGTPGYLSPELLFGRPVGPRADLFALGLVLYEALFGRRAVDVNDAEGNRRAFERGEPLVEASTPEAPPSLLEVIRHACALDPEDRYPSANAMRRALQSFLAADRPHGLGPELSQRVDAARADANDVDAAADAPRPSPSSGPVKTATWATRPELTTWLTTAALPPVAPTVEASDVGTQAIPGRAKPAVGPPSRSTPVGRWRLRALRAVALRAVALRWLALGVAVAAVAGLFAASEARRVASGNVRPPGPTAQNATAQNATAQNARLTAVPASSGSSSPVDPRAVDPLAAGPLAVGAITVHDAAQTAVEQAARAPAPPASQRRPTGRITVNSTPYSRVFVDGRDRGATPLRGLHVAAGAHRIRFENPAYESVERRIRVEAHQSVRVLADLRPDPPTVRVQVSE